MAKPVATSASAPARADSRRCSHMPSPTSPAPSTAPNATRAGGVNQPRDAARASRRTTPSSVTAPPVQASSRAPVSGDRFGTAGAAAPQAPAAGPRAVRRAVRPQADRRARQPLAGPRGAAAEPGTGTERPAEGRPPGSRRVATGASPGRGRSPRPGDPRTGGAAPRRPFPGPPGHGARNRPEPAPAVTRRCRLPRHRQRDRPPVGRRTGACRSRPRHCRSRSVISSTPMPSSLRPDPPEFGGQRGERVGRRSGGHVRILPRSEGPCHAYHYPGFDHGMVTTLDRRIAGRGNPSSPRTSN